MERELKQDFKSGAATFSGWVVEQLGSVPQKGDKFHYGKCAVQITAADEKRVLEAIVQFDPPLIED